MCGGGAHNTALVTQIKKLLGKKFTVSLTDEHTVPSHWLEAMLFAWLAKLRLEGQALNLKTITGSKEPALLGGIYR